MKRTIWIPLNEALKELGVSRSTFDGWRQQGIAPQTLKLPSGKVKVSRADLDRFIENCIERVA